MEQSKTTPNLVPNRPSDEGRQLGEQLARLTDKAWIELKAKFPNHMERCSSCAFRGGTFPNGCLVTVMDALKCAVENIPFYCHHNLDAEGKPTDLCAGFMAAQFALSNVEKPFPLTRLPYELSE